MKITVVGPGAVGCLVAALMLKAGFNVYVLDRKPERAERIKKSGLVIEEGGRKYCVECKNIFTEAEQIGCADIVFITVKAFDTEQAVKKIIPAVGENTVMVSLQNGLFNVESIMKILSTQKVAAATTSHGSTLLDDGFVSHVGTGDSVIGNAGLLNDDEIIKIKNILDRSGINTEVSDNINSVLWGKLLINSAINPVTAISGIKNGEVLNHPNLIALMSMAVTEVCKVAEANQIKISFSDPLEKVKEVCRATAQNTSSMLADIRAGRRTEIDFINGAVISFGKNKGIDTPVNQMLRDTVNSLSAG